MAVPYVGFKNELEVYGTGDLGHVAAAMNAKALVAGRVLLKRAKMESDKMLKGAVERLRLTVENEELNKELAALQALDDSRQKQNEDLKERARRRDVVVAEMQKEIDSKEETIEGLRQEIAKGVDNAKKAEQLAVHLSD